MPRLRRRLTGEVYHVTILAKDQQGLEDLNRLVSSSHLEYFHKPQDSKPSLEKEGSFDGSAREAGSCTGYTAKATEQKK